jgi:Zn ribbon nucleic-acid-binding protein
MYVPPVANNAGVVCPKCQTRDAVAANKEGFGLGNAVAGLFFLGPLGLLGGLVGSNSLNITCLACGFNWKPGQQNHLQYIDPTAKFSWKRVLLTILAGSIVMITVLYLFRETLRK